MTEDFESRYDDQSVDEWTETLRGETPLLISQGKDGLWHEYSDEWDLTIHHETEEEFNRTKRMFEMASDDDLISRAHLLKVITPKSADMLNRLQYIRGNGEIALALVEILELILVEPGVMELEEEEEEK